MKDRDVEHLCSDAWWAQVNRRQRERRRRSIKQGLWTVAGAILIGTVATLLSLWLSDIRWP